MTHLVRHNLSCPSCPSRDAYAEYDDGYYCFSCHYSKVKERSKCRKLSRKHDAIDHEVKLPTTFTTDLPVNYKAYLYSLEFTDEMIEASRIGYTADFLKYSARINNYFHAGARLILPSYDDDNVLQFYQAKSIEQDKIKYLSIGVDRTTLFMSASTVQSKTLIIVEDMLSAIKLTSCKYRAIALLGTNITTEKVMQIVSYYVNNQVNRVVIWLDSDAAGQKARQKLLNLLSLFIDNISIVETDEDPKACSQQLIDTRLNNE